MAPVTIWLGHHPVGTRAPHQTSQNQPQVWLTLTSSREHAPGSSPLLPSPLPASHTDPHIRAWLPGHPDTDEMGDTPSFHSSPLTHVHVHTSTSTDAHACTRETVGMLV